MRYLMFLTAVVVLGWGALATAMVTALVASIWLGSWVEGIMFVISAALYSSVAVLAAVTLGEEWLS